MSGIIAVYGLVVAVLISQALSPSSNLSLYTYDWKRNNILQSEMIYSEANGGYSSFMHLAAGLSVGLTGIAAGYTIGIVGDAVRLHSTLLSSDHNLGINLSNGYTRVCELTCNNLVSTWA